MNESLAGGSVECGSDTPSAEALVGWLLEHQELHVAELSEDSESLPSIEGFTDSDSMSDDFEDMEGAFGEVHTNFTNILITFANIYCRDVFMIVV